MSIFGKDKEQDQRLDEIERHLRRLIEQVGQLSVDLSVTRVELRQAGVALDEKVSIADVDTGMVELNDQIAAARQALAEAKQAADEDWITLQDDVSRLVDHLRESASRYASSD